MMLRLGGFVGAKQLPNVEFNEDLESYQYTTTFLLRHENTTKVFFCLTSENSRMYLDRSLVLRKILEDDNLIISQPFNKILEFILPQKSKEIIDDSLNIFQ